MPTWSGIIQIPETGKASEIMCIAVVIVANAGDQVVGQVPVKARYEQA